MLFGEGIRHSFDSPSSERSEVKHRCKNLGQEFPECDEVQGSRSPVRCGWAMNTADTCGTVTHWQARSNPSTNYALTLSLNVKLRFR